MTNKKNIMEIVGILLLSLLITSTMAVSGGLPEMLNDFSTHSRASMEFLMSAPTITILIVIAFTPILSRYVKARIMICAGLLIVGIAGTAPMYLTTYKAILFSRILLGAGIGLINTYAVTLVGERFSGDLRQKLQGIRCSMETLGEAALIFIAGQLLVFGWNYSFLVYGFAFVILVLYLCFVPARKVSANVPIKEGKHHTITSGEWRIILQNALLGSLFVSTLTANALRISSFVVASNLGTAVSGSTILSISIFAGFLGGLAFGRLFQVISNLLLPLSMFLTASGLVLLVLGGSLATITIGASICGFFSTIALSYMFNTLSDRLITEVLTTANAIVLVGCNLGAALTPFVLQAIGALHSSLDAGFLAYAVLYFLLSIALLLKTSGCSQQ